MSIALSFLGLFLWDKISKVGLIGEIYGHFYSFKYTIVKLLKYVILIVKALCGSLQNI